MAPRKAAAQPADVVKLQPRSARTGWAERARAARTGLRRRTWVLLGWGGLGVVLAWLVFFSPLFALRTEEIALDAPSGQLDSAAVLAATAAHAGTPLTRLGTGALRQELLGIPTVADATVARAWPRGLRITVSARAVAAAVPGEGGWELYGLDGVHMGTATAAPGDVPIIEVPVGDGTARIVTAVLEVLAAIPPELRAEAVGLSARTVDSIVFTLADGTTVFWGSATENDLKAAVLQTLRQVPAQVYDVSAPRTPLTS